MKKYIVKTPNPSFVGTRAGVQFYLGEAEGELTEEQVAELKDSGYEVKPVAPKKKKSEK